MVSKYHWGAGNQLKHILVAESVLGRALPDGAEVHHVDGNGKNNAHDNLVICPSHAYHFMLHTRMRALAACGNANWAKCVICKTWDDKSQLQLKKARMIQYFHRKCDAISHLLRTRKSYSELDQAKNHPKEIT